MPNINEEKAKKLGDLLAESPLADELKDAIISNLAKIPIGFIDNLIVSLESEKEKVEEIASSIKDFFEEQDKNWKELEEKQANEAERIIKEEIEQIEQETIKSEIEKKSE
jgi:hypothetical protein